MGDRSCAETTIIQSQNYNYMWGHLSARNAIFYSGTSDSNSTVVYQFYGVSSGDDLSVPAHCLKS